MYHVPACLNPKLIRMALTSWCGIEFYWAKVGHGKTYHIVKNRLLPALMEGRNVYTNINFGGPLMINDCEVFSEELRAGMIISDYLKKDIREQFHVIGGDWVRATLNMGSSQKDFNNIPNGSRIILDEVQDIFPIGGYKAAPEGFFRLLCKCRHYDIDFVFISQNTSLVDKRIVSTCSDFIKIKNAGFLSSFLSKTYRVTHHQSVFDFEGYSSSIHKFDPDIFTLYKSANAIVKKTHKKIPTFFWVPVVCVFIWFLYMFFNIRGSHFFGSKGYSDKLKTSTISTIPPVQALPYTIPQGIPDTETRARWLDRAASSGSGVMTPSQAVSYLHQMDFRDTPASPVELPPDRVVKWTYAPPKPYIPQYEGGIEVLKAQ